MTRRRPRARWLACLALCLASTAAARAGNGEGSVDGLATPRHWSNAPLHSTQFKPRDKVIWMGDERIGESAIARYATAGFLRLMPEQDLKFWRFGLRGGRVSDGAEAWGARTVFFTRASSAIVCFGLHDGDFVRGDGPAAEAERDRVVEAYGAALGLLMDELQARGVRVVCVVSPLPVDEEAPGGHGWYTGYNATLRALGAKAAAVAEARRQPFIDAFTPLLDAMKKARAEGQSLAPDGVTLTTVGEVIAARAIIEGLEFDQDSLAEIGWRPAPSPDMDAADALTGSKAGGDSAERAQSFALAQAIGDFDTHFDLLNALDQELHPFHPDRAEMIRMQKAQTDRDWEAVRRIARGESSPAAP